MSEGSPEFTTSKDKALNNKNRRKEKNNENFFRRYPVVSGQIYSGKELRGIYQTGGAE